MSLHTGLHHPTTAELVRYAASEDGSQRAALHLFSSGGDKHHGDVTVYFHDVARAEAIAEVWNATAAATVVEPAELEPTTVAAPLAVEAAE
ncbi:hypothetical protein ATO13_22186 [Stappia sp. 22II-S9-Z10]|nr:hypothetical protein ATO13_22186 [Stappia sp. 22II-S9-Z10]